MLLMLPLVVVLGLLLLLVLVVVVVVLVVVLVRAMGAYFKKKSWRGVGGRAPRLPPNAFVARNV